MIAANTTHGRHSKAYAEKGNAIGQELLQIILDYHRVGMLPYKSSGYLKLN